jgi:leucyl-tRNA synthetase
MYDHKKIEKKWQERWEKEGLYKAKDFSNKPKYYFLIEFPYPSGDGLHVGHPRSYTALDILARKKRMEGYNVLFPIGFDAFGLPSENYAIKTGVHPAITTKKNIETFTKQLKSIGFSFDWSRVITTTDPDYYKWTQWIFLKLYKHGLAYKDKMPINWCLSCKIGLANEEVVNGQCERCGGDVEKREKEQWMLKITKYADKLIEGLDKIDYWDKIKNQQINWIGRKEWIDISYPVKGTNEKIVVSTTRPDTNFGATFVVLAPEHHLLSSKKELIPKQYKKQVEDYIKKAKNKSELERISEGREKTGVFTGLYCINQLNNKKMPIWVSDFVLSTVGTGALVGVPGHDVRDFEFAQKFNLPVIRVVVGKDGDTSEITKKEQVQEDEGKMVNSEFLDGMDIHKATVTMMDYLEKKKWGKRAIRYNLRDWVFSRQRYWGEPIPMINCEQCGWQPVPESELPVKLPEVEKYEPTDSGESPLAAIKDWVNTKCPKCGGAAKRETDTMPNWAGSSWYFLRYVDPHNNKELASKEKLKYWTPVDWYNGGMEHTTLHLLYSRFWYKFLYDIGIIPKECGAEPYKKRTSHGMILGEGGIKMSKSKGNVVNPDDVVKEHGADVLRMYEMFMGPFDQAIPWDTKGVEGINRFLKKIYKLSDKLQISTRQLTDKTQTNSKSQNSKLENLLHKTIKKVTQDIENLRFNTAISAMMILLNEFEKEKEIDIIHYSLFIILLSPFAPHLAEELWEKLGHKDSIFRQSWPKYDEALARDEEIELVIQINGKVRDKITVSADISETQAKEKALASEKIKKWLDGKEPKKIIFVRGKLVSIVI